MRDRRRAYGRGHRAERLAALLLRLKGYGIVARRFRCPAGEIDIVARRLGILAVVEVKARDRFEAAVDAVTATQRRRILRAAEFLASRDPELSRLQLRFDVIVVLPYRVPLHIMDAWRP